MARIGLFGGTFNPIHVGHLTIAEEARLAAGLDRVIFIPTGESYLKDPLEVAPKGDRLEMTRLACGDVYEVSDLEVRRDGPSYTAVTCREFREMYPGDDLYWILGADSLLDMARWRDPEVILDTVTLLAFTRGGMDDSDFLARVEQLRREQNARIEVVDVFQIDVASSDIRHFVREGHAYRHLVTEDVYRYIRKRGLYGHGR
ncbi:MAG: nicotinate-nucleotide adenylyltransferase [Clostridia bacterium]|nr:nicotinate-nucleotide adenylyltransferase [Clostridia bacterium]